MRVEDPLRLAEYVLADQPQWTTKKIAAAMQSGQEQGVRLKTTLPVHIGYWTAGVRPDGAVTFTDDPTSSTQRQIQRFHQTSETTTW